MAVLLPIIYFIGIPAFCACKKSRTVAGQDINDRGGGEYGTRYAKGRPYDAGIVMEDGAGPPADGIWAPEGRKENRKG